MRPPNNDVEATPREIAKHVYEKIMKTVDRYLKEKEDLCKQQGIPYEKILKVGHPVDDILKIAEESNAGLIVLGARGRSAFAGSVFGSIAYGVLHRDKNTPVLVVKC
ncbi:MAG: universal stress protein [Deltaproteobacteria bacterium]|nr:universal stress protein [Deltaproteobacteria bacterium]